MKIDSSRIGMESARSYASIASRTVNYQTRFANLGVAKEGNEKSFSDLLESKEGEGALGETGLSMQDRYYSVAGARNLSSMDEKRAVESVKMQCLQYLIYWLFGGKSHDRF